MKLYVVSKLLKNDVFKTNNAFAYVLAWGYGILNLIFMIYVYYLNFEISAAMQYYFLGIEVSVQKLIMIRDIGSVLFAFFLICFTMFYFEEVVKSNPQIFIGHRRSFSGPRMDKLLSFFKYFSRDIERDL